MPLPLAFKTSPRHLALAGLSALLLLAAFACTGAQGATPTCTPDTGDAGITPTNGGCNGFADCIDERGQKAKTPEEVQAACCKELKDNSLATCLFAYGAGPAPGGSSTSASSGSSTSSAGGSGGAGGGG